jgi:hypothetical protein
MRPSVLSQYISIAERDQGKPSGPGYGGLAGGGMSRSPVAQVDGSERE